MSFRALSYGLFLAVAISSTSHAQDEATIFLDSTAQIIRGFGANNIVQWRPDMTDSEMETAFGTGDGQLGFSILRLRIPPDQNQWSINVPSATMANEMGVTLIASPWSPPASMKTNNSLVAGELREDSYQAFADYLNDFTEYMEGEGIPIYAVSVQNEPDVSVTYESCDYSPEQMRKFVAENGASINTRLMAPESFQFRKVMSDPILNDSAATANVDIIGGHIYGGGLNAYPLAVEKGKEVWMTEHLVLETDYAANLGTAKEIQSVMQAGMSAYVWWYIVRFYGPISDGEQGSPYQKGEVTKRGYMMSQFSRFIRPGFVRVHTLDSGLQSDVSVTAYKDDSGVVIVAINDEATPVDVDFKVDGSPIIVHSRYVTSETQNTEELGPVNQDGNQFVVTLGAKSVTTFVADYWTVSTENVTPSPASGRLLQNYPNPFDGSTAIGFTLSESSHVSLEVFDLLGRRVATVIDGFLAAGRHEVGFEPAFLSPGTYIYQFKAGNAVQSRTMTLAK